MTDNVIETMRNGLVPQGSEPLVRLFLKEAAYFKHDFVTQCIDEFEKMPMMIALGEPISPLQRLAVQVLKDSAYIKLKNEN